ncbi:TRAP transporter large permease [Ornithinimicrobium cavernae]|uniref:TRAP transporter large permease n=1 Tax=Ornithinimicrobium cavernae TaxID=2666047 RepID=UPI000D699011|nr:TRAP transporter large permease [Ornithinimicrobium cavernae]
MSADLIVVLAVTLLVVLIAIKVPIYVSLGVSGLLGLYFMQGLIGLDQVPIALVSQLQNYSLMAAPLFIFMGEVLAVSGLGRDLFRAAYRWLGRVPGGLAASAIGSSTAFGAMSGVSISSVAVVGRMAVPEMLDRGYRPSYASGSVVASGALAMLIPPSLMFILYSSVTGVGVADLFTGGIVPGLMLSGLMILWVVFVAVVKPSWAPAPPEKFTLAEKMSSLLRITPAMVLILLVLGSIYAGWATPTEAAAVGAAGAIVLVGVFYRALNWANMKAAMVATTFVSTVLMVIVGTAFIFTQMLVVARVPDKITAYVTALDLAPIVIILIMMVILVLLGCLVDAASLLLVVTPILLPTVVALGYDPLWLGIILVVNLEMAVITPPVGLNLYTMKSVVPDLDLADIFKGVVPYIIIEFALLLLLIFVPEIALWLPNQR